MSRDTLTPEQRGLVTDAVRYTVRGDADPGHVDGLLDALNARGLAVVPVGDDEPLGIYKHECGHCHRFSPVMVPESTLTWMARRYDIPGAQHAHESTRVSALNPKNLDTQKAGGPDGE